MFIAFHLRTSPAEFIVPIRDYSIGMRFRMRFEGEEAAEQRFIGTVVGNEDADPKRWPESKWRSLKVWWDESSTIPCRERVSPWNIEPASVPPALNALPASRPKRPRPIMATSPTSSVLTREGPSLANFESSPANGTPRVLQGQEVSTLRVTFVQGSESDSAAKQVAWPQTMDGERIVHMAKSHF